MSPEPLYILGAGMHPWGKWGNDFTEYGVAAARAALSEAGLDWRQIQLVAGADTIRNGYPGFVAGCDVRAEAGLERRSGVIVDMRRVPADPKRCRVPAHRSWPGSATSRSSSAPTPRPRGSSPRSAANERTTRTGSAST